MASNQTANLGLCQWAADDPVVRADFNADNQKLDAAVARVRLREITTTANAVQVDIDVSDIDWTEYLYVDLYAEIRLNNANGGVPLLLNNVSASNQYYRATLTETPYTTTCIGLFRNDYVTGGVLTRRGRSRVRLFGGGDVMYALFLNCGYRSTGYMLDFERGWTAEGSGITGTNVTLLSVYYNASDPIQAGSKFTIYGVRK